MERDRSRIVKGMTLYGDSYPGQIVTKSQEPPVRYGQQVPSSDEIQRRIAAAKRKIDFLRGKMKK